MPMANFDELDLHGVPPDPARLSFLLQKAMDQAKRRHLGLRIIHGRGEGVMAELVGELLRSLEVEHQRGILNPGETRITARELQRRR